VTQRQSPKAVPCQKQGTESNNQPAEASCSNADEVARAITARGQAMAMALICHDNGAVCGGWRSLWDANDVTVESHHTAALE